MKFMVAYVTNDPIQEVVSENKKTGEKTYQNTGEYNKNRVTCKVIVPGEATSEDVLSLDMATVIASIRKVAAEPIKTSSNGEVLVNVPDSLAVDTKRTSYKLFDAVEEEYDGCKAFFLHLFGRPPARPLVWVEG